MPRVVAQHCSNVLTYPQYTGTCWFNALIMAVFYSQGVRQTIVKAREKWEKTTNTKLKPIYKLFAKLLDTYEGRGKLDAFLVYEAMKNITPEMILQTLYKYDPKNFYINPTEKNGWQGKLYIPQLFKVLDAGDFVALDIVQLPGTNEWGIFISPRNFPPDYKKGLNMVDYKISNASIKKLIQSNPSIVSVTVGLQDMEVIPFFEEFPKLLLKKIPTPHPNQRIHAFGQDFIVDSMILANFNEEICRMGHEIAGVTCNEQRYIYNGWMADTLDAAMIQDIRNKQKAKGMSIPCELMEHNWMKEDNAFCLDPNSCNLDFLSQTHAKRLQFIDVCFKFDEGDRTYLYVRENTMYSPALLPTHQKVDKVNQGKLCPKDKETSVKTGKCVIKCKKGQKRNPSTGKCKKVADSRATTATMGKSVKKCKENACMLMQKQKKKKKNNKV
jgi:hypothetical protein